MLSTFVVHTRLLPERELWITQELASIQLPFEWVDEFEPKAISAEVEARYFAPNVALSIGQKSCALKHIAAMEKIANANLGTALILEDDASLCPDFLNILSDFIAEAGQWPRPWVLHVGAATNYYVPGHKIVPGRHVYEGHKVRNMEAYVLGAEEARRRLSWIQANKLSDPIDIAMNKADPEMGIPFLWTDPPLVEQGSLTGRFASSLDPKKRPQWRLRIQFPIQKFKRRWLYRWFRLS
jgi:glycosyl transferase family 25